MLNLTKRRLLLAVMAAALVAGCNNSPYPVGAERENTLYMAFTERSPRYLDPTSSYAAPESIYVYEISEPPYGYHHLKRPYTLIPRAAAPSRSSARAHAAPVNSLICSACPPPQ